MTALRAVRRRNTLVALAAGVAALALVPVAAVVGGAAISSSTAAVNVGDDALLEIPPTPVGALATVDGAGALSSITAFALSPSGAGGTVLSVPVGSRVRAGGVNGASLGAVGGVRLADVYGTEGAEVFQRELSGLLNTSLAFVEVLSGELAGDLLEASGLPSGSVDRIVEVMQPPSAESTDLADVVEPAEQQRWSEVGEAWTQAVESFATSNATGSASPVEPGDLRALMSAVFDGTVAYHQFALTPVLSSEGNPEGLDLYDLDRSEVVLVMASVAPSAVVAANPSVSVQIDSGFDFVVTKRAVASLLFVGANVLLVRQVDEPPPQVTQVKTSVRLSTKEVVAFEKLFGPIEVSSAEQQVEGIDVQIRLGTAFAVAEDEQ